MTKTDRLIDVIQKQGLIRPRDLRKLRIPLDYLDRLHKRGIIERISRGVYAWPGIDLGEHQSLVEAVKQVPKGIICLLSALAYYEIGTQQPHEIWLAIPISAWKPKLDYPQVRIVRFSEEAYSLCVRTQMMNGIKMKIYSPAKTIADCFKYRNKIGIDVAIEALRECWRQKLATMDELWESARVCRMSRVMRPYLESLT